MRRLRSRLSCPEAALTATTADARAHAPARGLGDHRRRARRDGRGRSAAPAPASPRRSARRARAGARAARRPAAPGAPSRRRGSRRRRGRRASRRPRASRPRVRATTSSPVIAPALAPSWPGAQETTRCGRLAVPRVDLLGRAPRADRLDRLHRGLAQLARQRLAVLLAQQRQVQPQRGEEAAVAPARAHPAALGLEHHHARVRLRLGDLPRRPQPGVAAADHHDVGVDVAGQRGHRRRRARLGDPPAVRVVDHSRRLDRGALFLAQPLGDVAAHRVAREARRAGRPAPRGSRGWRRGGGAASSRPRGRRPGARRSTRAASATARSVHSRKPGTVTAIRPSGSLAAASWPAPIEQQVGARRRGSPARRRARRPARSPRRPCPRAAGR